MAVQCTPCSDTAAYFFRKCWQLTVDQPGLRWREETAGNCRHMCLRGGCGVLAGAAAQYAPLTPFHVHPLRHPAGTPTPLLLFANVWS